MNILIADDEKAYRMLLFEHLSAKHDVSIVSDGIGAVALLHAPTRHYDLVILDIRMPGLDGGVLLDTFAQWSACRTSFLVISGEIDPQEYSKIPSVIACLSKPFSLAQLDEQIASWERGKISAA